MIACPKGASTLNVSLGLANGAWETAVTLAHQNNSGGAEADGDWSATWGAVVRGNSDVAINVAYAGNPNWATRMVGVDDSGKPMVIPKNSSSVSTLSTGGILLVPSNEFAHIKEFQLRRRPYHWVGFRNGSLKPGHQTKVAISDFGDAATPDESTTSTPGSAGVPPAEPGGAHGTRALPEPLRFHSHATRPDVLGSASRVTLWPDLCQPWRLGGGGADFIRLIRSQRGHQQSSAAANSSPTLRFIPSQR